MKNQRLHHDLRLDYPLNSTGYAFCTNCTKFLTGIREYPTGETASGRGKREDGKVTFGRQAKNLVYSFVYSCSSNRARTLDFIGLYCGVHGHKFY